MDDSGLAEAKAEALRAFGAKEFERALALARDILEAAPQVSLSWRFHGECLFFLDRLDEAVASFQEAVELGGPGTPELPLWIAMCQSNAGRHGEAAETLRQALKTGGLTPGQRANAERILKQEEKKADRV